MPRDDMNDPQSANRKLTPEECTELAETFADLALDPANGWIRELFLTGFNLPKDYLAFLGEKMGIKERPSDPHFDKKFSNALENMDKQSLVAMVKVEFEQKPPTKESAERLLKMFDRGLWRREGSRQRR